MRQKTVEEILEEDLLEHDFAPERTWSRQIFIHHFYEPVQERLPEENIFSYTSIKETDLEERLAKPKPLPEKPKQDEQNKKKQQQRRRATLNQVLLYVPEISPYQESEERLFKEYFGSEHYKDLEHYLEKTEKREAFPLLGTGRIPLRRQDGTRGPVAAMHPTERGAYITIDEDYERHLRAMARGYRVPSPLTLEERADALREYSLDHENVHRYQKSKILAGTPEDVLERDVESTLWKFYNHQVRKYQGAPLEAKYSYLRGIAGQRFKDVEAVYGSSRMVKVGKN